MKVAEIAKVIRQKARMRRPVLIAIEGYGGSGKSTLAGKLKQLLPNCEVIEIDSFILKDKAQNTEPWEKVFDRRRLEEQVLGPARTGETIRYQRLDWASNKLGTDIFVSEADHIIIEGITSYHPSLEHYYDFKIWVDTPIEVAKKRGQLRDSDNENASLWDKWAQCDLAYQKSYHPEERADFIIRNN